MNDDRENNHGFWLGFFLGGLLGAIILILMATKEGKNLGEKLREEGEKLLGGLEGKIEEEATTETMDKLDNALAKLEDAQVRAQETTEAIRKKFFTRAGKKLS